jgi:signal transduction histidine kinase
MSRPPLAIVRPDSEQSDAGNSAAAADDHSVQLYERDDFLCETVAEFVVEGLRAGEGVVVVATADHRRGIAEQLGADAARVTFLDARETLALIMHDGAPDPERFRVHAAEPLARLRAASASGGVRAYGEMVDVLWSDGLMEAAIALEELWCDLRRTDPFPLLCSYALAGFHREDQRAGFERVLATHGHVSPAESYPRAAQARNDGAQLREIAYLQQRARALETEIQRRKELERELQRQNEVLARTVRFSETFVGVLGHDLRNPLSAIATSARLLVRRAEATRLRTPAERIVSSADRMARMIDQLLDFTRIRLGKGIPLARRAVHLGALCRQAIDELAAAGHAAACIELEVAHDPSGQWDAERLVQLFSNLAGNALAHGTPGEPVLIRVGGDEHHGTAEVENAGVVPDDVLPVIFHPLKSHGERKREGSSGLGLGLYISEQIVLAHAGTIAVESSEGRGTRVSVRLPRIPPVGAAGAAGAAEAAGDRTEM